MKQKLKILLLEDSPDDALLIEKYLRKHLDFEIIVVDKKNDFNTQLIDFNPNVVLSDHSLKQFDSIDALKMTKDVSFDIPFILVTGNVSEEFAVHSIKAGADNYVLKDNLIRLPSAIESALETSIQKSAKKIAEEELRKQNEILVKTNKELDAFVYRVGHDLRAPLLSILGLFNLMDVLNLDASSELQEYLSKIRTTTLQLDGTIREILDYSRNSRLDSIRESFNIIDTINESFERLNYIPEQTEVKLNISSEGQITQVEHDLFRVRIIISNMLTNAIKYSDPEKRDKKIDINIEVENNVLEMTFKDNGIGIPEDRVQKIYDMFYRAHDRMSAGSGLGLYIVKEIISFLEGSIEVNTQEGEGTEFIIKLPI